MMLRRILEPVFLGCTANVAINFLFNPNAFEIIPSEFVAACILSIPITECNGYIDRRLERKITWLENPRKRLITHFLFISLLLLILLNMLGSGYMWIAQKGFFSWKELLVINLVTLCLAMTLTLVKWGTHFYTRWVRAESKASASAKMAEDLRKSMTGFPQSIEIQKGVSKINMEIQAIRMARIAFGTVRLYSSAGECGVFPGTLSQLAAQLPGYLFFQVTRDAILHREMISSISTSTFGKIQLTIKQPLDVGFTVSRPKAAAFRKWYNSNSG
ncbi:LytTr DNA-binding domain-containing protein [Chryseolinea serpens]|uniref:LytTr DNA-binding domain-containing protein n=1 Tax=Chryseolinea serpens TaxID=947013 RepID=A0A1M5P6N7_9BACT|nr:LytTR family DNA-binding domain-containing protein [Chryseolinea serpens]SHG97446.1 LytTr DNA-binding domain-containing protein [Chryseolinea serpens]